MKDIVRLKANIRLNQDRCIVSIYKRKNRKIVYNHLKESSFESGGFYWLVEVINNVWSCHLLKIAIYN